MAASTPRTALVTGVTGQIGFYVAEQLAADDTRVFGLVRQMPRDAGALPYTPIAGDLLDEYALLTVLERTRPDEVYNFAAQTFIPTSWEQPMLTAQYTGLALVRILEAVRRVVPEARVLQAGSSELYANAGVSPQSESTAILPRNPYGAAKAFAYHLVVAYRQQYGLRASNAVFFTNESPRRPADFLFRKVTQGVARIVARGGPKLKLGNLDAVRDWGYTPDYADASVRIVRHREASDFVVATGEGHTVRELVETAFGLVDRDWRAWVESDAGLHRAAEPAPMVGDARKAERELGWTPRVRFPALVRTLLAHDLRAEGAAVPFDP